MINLKEYFYKQKVKSKLLDCFRSAEIFFTAKSGNRTVYIYPKIHSIVNKEKDNLTEIVFTLKNGMNPTDLIKQRFVFEQYFGKSIDLKGDLKKFVLTVYNKPLTSNVVYSYDEIFPFLKEMKIPIVVGKKKNGRYLVLECLDLPHIIIQGTTGSGKSSAIRVILSTLIKYKRPEELDIYCIDGKRAEFGLFKKVEHVQKVVYSNKDARQVLKNVTKIMYEREELLDTFDVPHIDDLPKDRRQKYILVAVDEFIEYMDDKKIMDDIIKISSKGRAVGIFLLASAQRMDADIMDTKARGNFNIRMSFRAVDKTNAMLLGTKGAEKIKREEKGRLILNSGEIEELQSPHLTYEKAKKILNPFMIVKGDIKDVTEGHNELQFQKGLMQSEPQQ
ncbi:FtsK/SpoIIIE domain-containing protein, partial [Bacillus sp. JJ1503]|uniref:FtsK/SpoIIIE domain-containing protein n=1 Tax=Bacillus sp. JJ1503 TaxID=3122956 RepID=UPI002FFEFD6F